MIAIPSNAGILIQKYIKVLKPPKGCTIWIPNITITSINVLEKLYYF